MLTRDMHNVSRIHAPRMRQLTTYMHELMHHAYVCHLLYPSKLESQSRLRPSQSRGFQAKLGPNNPTDKLVCFCWCSCIAGSAHPNQVDRSTHDTRALTSCCPIIDKLSFTRNYTYLMDHKEDLQLARTRTAFFAIVFTLFGCAAQLVEDPCFSGEKERSTREVTRVSHKVSTEGQLK